MDWNNVDLNSHEVDQYLIDPLTFKTLLLEIGCNHPVISRETVTAQFEEDLMCRVEEARRVFNANLDNLVLFAQETRDSD